MIYEAVQAWQRDYPGQWPDALSDLVPRYLHDPAQLNCPQAVRAGLFTLTKRGIRNNEASEPYGNYNWELGPKPMEDFWFGDGKRRTWAELRLLGAKARHGGKVPIIRCETVEQQVLNLGLDGSFYVSPLYWEGKFDRGFPAMYETPYLLWRDQRPIAERLPESTGLVSNSVDLGPACNACFGDPWLESYGSKVLPLRKDAATIIEFAGIRFEVRGIVQVGGSLRKDGNKDGFAGHGYQATSGGFSIGRRCARLHFLHAMAFHAPVGENVGEYEFTTAAGVQHTIALRAGQEIASWLDGQPSAAKQAWQGRNGAGECVLFHFVWANPVPEDPIVAGRLKANEKSVGSPFLVGITMEPMPGQ